MLPGLFFCVLKMVVSQNKGTLILGNPRRGRKIGFRAPGAAADLRVFQNFPPWNPV